MSSESRLTRLGDAPTLRYLDPRQVRVFRNAEMDNRVLRTALPTKWC